MTRKIVLDIKALRKEKNMTISELANRLNKTIFEIKVWEDNGHKVSIKDLDSLHQILGYSINYVVFNNERNILSVRGLTVKQIQLLLKLIEEISDEEIKMHISEKIKFIRTKILNVSAQKFANMCGVTARTVYAWESGVSLPCLDNIVAIANTCHASLDYLLIDDHEFELCFPNLDDETFKCISHLSNKMKEENEVNQISNTVE